MALTEKQKRFADEYLKSLNAADAYRKAGYKSKTDSAITSNASRLLTNDKVSRYLQERLDEHKLNDFMDQTEVLERLSDIARGIPQKTVYQHYDRLEEEMTTDSETTRSPDVMDQLSALQMLGKYHKLFVDKAEVEFTTPEFVDDVPEGDDDDSDSQTPEA